MHGLLPVGIHRLRITLVKRFYPDCSILRYCLGTVSCRPTAKPHHGMDFNLAIKT